MPHDAFGRRIAVAIDDDAGRCVETPLPLTPREADVRRDVLLLLLVSLAVRALCVPFLAITYDELGYAWSANRLVAEHGWLGLRGLNDLFYWPPLFPYLAALPIALGIDRLWAVRTVTLLLSSAIPPVLYLLVRRAGHGVRAARLTAMLWIVCPWAFCYSVVGQVETPMLALVLLALLLLQRAREDGRWRTALLSSVALAMAVWTKETAIGLVPLFPLFLWRRRGMLVAWCTGFAALVLPVLLPSFLSGSFGLFFEVTNPAARSSSFNLDVLLENMVRIHGLEPLAHGRINYATGLAVAVTLVLAVLSAWPAIRRGDFLLRFAGVALALLVCFLTVFWKKFPYYAIMPYGFLVVFVGIYLARLRWWSWIYLALLALLSVATVVGLADRRGEAALIAALRAAEAEQRGASVAMPVPRIAEYLAEREGIDVRVSPDDWMMCSDRPRDCMLGHDYLLGSTDGLRRLCVALFCKGFPARRECDRRAARAALGQVRLVGAWADQLLYRLHDPTSSTVRRRDGPGDIRD